MNQKVYANQAIKIKVFQDQISGIAINRNLLLQLLEQNPDNNSWVSKKTGETVNELVLNIKQGKFGPELYVKGPRQDGRPTNEPTQNWHVERNQPNHYEF